MVVLKCQSRRGNPSLLPTALLLEEQVAQLSEQIHLGRLRRFDIEDWCSWRGGFGWGRFRLAIQKLSQFFEVLTKQFEHAALV